jgi:hypothetical protein
MHVISLKKKIYKYQNEYKYETPEQEHLTIKQRKQQIRLKTTVILVIVISKYTKYSYSHRKNHKIIFLL